MNRRSPATEAAAKILWRYHRLTQVVHSCDAIVALGSHDERVASYAAELYKHGVAPLLITTGGFGKVTGDSWQIPEAVRFAEIAQAAGVPREAILIEPQSTNTGDNFVFSKALVEKTGRKIASAVAVTKPYMCRRAFATACKQWPEVSWMVDAPSIDFEHYATQDVPYDKMIGLMVGDLQRMRIYFERGFQIRQDIPEDVGEAYHVLLEAGYDQYVIKAGDEKAAI